MKKLIIIVLSLSVFAGFSYGQSVRVVSPNGGEVWEDGSSHVISWAEGGVSGNIVVELIRTIMNRPSYSSAKVLYSGNINSGNNSFTWRIRENISLRPGTQNTYIIRITSVNNSSIRDISDRPFKISPKRITLPPASIEITNPNRDKVWNLYSPIPGFDKFSYYIMWNKKGYFRPGTMLRITLHGITGAARKFSALLAQSTPNDGHFSGEIPRRYPIGRYRIKMRIVGENKIIAESEVFKIIRKMPNPLGGLSDK